MIRTDIAIIGAGMAGASLAAEIGAGARVVLIESESRPGYHATGRSAAFWSETYGGPAVQPLTTASGACLRDGGFLRARGALHIADADGIAALAAMRAEFAGSGVPLDPVDRAGLEALLPGLAPAWTQGLSEPTCEDIDVGGLHAHYLAAARRAGATLLTDAAVTAIARAGPGWRLETRVGTVEAAVVVNAAGAWAGAVAALAGAMPIAITPYRRTMVQIAVDPAPRDDLPLVVDALGRFYFKPEAGGRLWLSPHDEAPTPPCDAAPEELDIAIAIDRYERLGLGVVRAKEHAWAGLRSFAPDRAPVYGFDAAAPGFFWFAGQGGFGIQTAPAAAMLGAALVTGGAMPEAVRAIDVDRYAPGRFA
ncbi:NAD(P)/FAD-dependent oxidoreductase [Sphingomonas sp. KC8]|uniref:NAD(P)/FAD-dependent oxidoreductase n=1 Tax=Sphingomonas sp. KC8 TaxID=1030157 RepID=UPI00024897F3|nr:FAD-dependent oxidoreductase [Sphingomonas sp. KC8]ARS27817.1 FAD dependent oxidoreductase [Sphingomonas sp. KC8]